MCFYLSTLTWSRIYDSKVLIKAGVFEIFRVVAVGKVSVNDISRECSLFCEAV